MKGLRFLLPVVLVLVILSLGIGASTSFSWLQLFQGEASAWQIFIQSRLPRTLAILLASGAMSLAGLLMQTVTQNRFAAPSTVGTVEAAQLGMLVALFFFPKATLGQKMLFAFVSAMLLTLFFIKVVRSLNFREKWMLPLVGLIYSGMIGSFAEIIAYRFNLVQSMSSWTQGSFSMVQTNQYEWLFLNVIIFIVVWYFAEGFSLLALGEDTNRLLGHSYHRMENLALFLVSLTTAVTIITVGSLPFLGVIVPNIVRHYAGDHLKQNQGLVILSGMILVLICDIFGRLVIQPYELSVSVVLGVIGSAIFIWMLWRGDAHG